MSNSEKGEMWIKLKESTEESICFLNLETGEKVKTLPDNVDSEAVNKIWTEVIGEDGVVVGYDCSTTHTFLPIYHKNKNSIDESNSRGTDTFDDHSSEFYNPTINARMDAFLSHTTDSSFLNTGQNNVGNLISMGNNTIQSIPEPKRTIVPNTESDRDAIIRQQSMEMAKAITKRLHPKTSFATHSDWKRVVDGHTVLYYDPITNVISSTLPDGYPIDPDELLYDDFIHGNDEKCLNYTVCTVNCLFSKVREQLEMRRHTMAAGEESSQSISSRQKWKESDSLSQPSVISNRSESGIPSHFSTLSRNRVNRDEDVEGGSIDRDGGDNLLGLLNDTIHSSHGTPFKRRINMITDLFDRIGSSSSLLSKRNGSTASTVFDGSGNVLMELKAVLFDDEEEVPPTLAMLTDYKMMEDKISYNPNFFSRCSYNVRVKYSFLKRFDILVVEKSFISLRGSSDRLDINYEEIDKITVLDLNGHPIEGLSSSYSDIQMTFKRPSDIILRDLIKDKGLKPITIHFRNACERLEFCTTYINLKRMYHEMFAHNQLYSDYHHDMKHSSVTWLITELSIDGVMPYRLTWFLPKATLDLGLISIATRMNERKYVIHVNDIVGMIQGKHDLNGVCTVHILLRTGERKTYAFENELNRYEFLNLARNCIGDEIVRKSSVSLS